jgi:PAS domain S-box-containing protein
VSGVVAIQSDGRGADSASIGWTLPAGGPSGRRITSQNVMPIRTAASSVEPSPGRRRAGWVALALALDTAIAAADLAFGGSLILITALAAGPVLAAARVGPVPTALVALYAVTLAALLGVVDGFFGDSDHLQRWAIASALSVLAVWMAALRERVHRAGDQMRVILEGVADGVIAQDASGRLVYANPAALEAIGLESDEELFSTPRAEVLSQFEMLDEDGRPFAPAQLPGRRALAGEEPPPTVIRWRRGGGGDEHWSAVKAAPVRDDAGDVRLAISIMRDVTESKLAERHQRFLAEAGEMLGQSLDFEATLRSVADLAVPDIADWCSIDLLDERGVAHLLALSATSEEEEQLARTLRDEYPPDLSAPQGLGHVLRSGDSELYEEISEQVLEALARDPRQLELYRSVGARSAMAVPLLARGRVLGAIVFASVGSGRRFTDRDLQLAEEIGRRAGVAVDNARLFTERAYIARALQESLLPPSLPDIPGVDVAARFHAAGEGTEVGGDFYDLFSTGEREWAVVMGDVCGKGADAAAVTALARYTLRAAAMRQVRPSAVLSTLNEAMVRSPESDQFATVAFAALNRDDGVARVTVASGGHPLPLVLRAGGDVEPAGQPGSLLGVLTRPQLTDATVALAPGDAVVFYTDGVIEAQAPRRVLSPEELSEVVAGCAGLDAAAIAARVEEAALADSRTPPRDDIAILVLKLRAAT